MAGSVELFIWSQSYREKHMDPSIYALFAGGNFGHAAVNVIIPKDEIDKDLEAAIKTNPWIVYSEKLVSSIEDSEIGSDGQVKNNVISVPCYEIYLSFWPNSDAGMSLISPMGKDSSTLTDDMEAERKHRKNKLTEKAKKHYGEKIKEVTTTAPVNILELISGRQKEDVFSGVLAIGRPVSEEDLSSISDTMQDIANMLPFIQLGQNFDGDRLSAQCKDIMDEINNLDLSAPIYKKITLQSNNVLMQIENAMARYLETHPDDISTKNSIEILQKLLDEVKLKLNNLTQDSSGIHPDYSIIIPTGENALNINGVIRGILNMTEKEYATINWNCASAALHAILEGLPQALKTGSLKKHIENLDKANEKVPIYTPFMAKNIGLKIQKRIIQNQAAKVSTDDPLDDHLQGLLVQEKKINKRVKKIAEYIKKKLLKIISQQQKASLASKKTPVEDPVLSSTDARSSNLITGEYQIYQCGKLNKDSLLNAKSKIVVEGDRTSSIMENFNSIKYLYKNRFKSDEEKRNANVNVKNWVDQLLLALESKGGKKNIVLTGKDIPDRMAVKIIAYCELRGYECAYHKAGFKRTQKKLDKAAEKMKKLMLDEEIALGEIERKIDNQQHHPIEDEIEAAFMKMGQHFVDLDKMHANENKDHLTAAPKTIVPPEPQIPDTVTIDIPEPKQAVHLPEHKKSLLLKELPVDEAFKKAFDMVKKGNLTEAELTDVYRFFSINTDLINKPYNKEDGNTLLHFAVKNSPEEPTEHELFITKLIYLGADPLLPNKTGETPYSLAVSEKEKNSIIIIAIRSAVKYKSTKIMNDSEEKRLVFEEWLAEFTGTNEGRKHMKMPVSGVKPENKTGMVKDLIKVIKGKGSVKNDLVMNNKNINEDKHKQ